MPTSHSVTLHRRHLKVLLIQLLLAFVLLSFLWAFFSYMQVHGNRFQEPAEVFKALRFAITIFFPERVLLDSEPWPLGLSSLLGSISMLLIVTQVLVLLFFQRIETYFLRFATDHTVVIGFGPSSQKLVQSLLARKGKRREKTIVVIEKHLTEEHKLLALQHNRLILLDGNGADVLFLDLVKVEKARRVIIASDQDVVNLEALHTALTHYEANKAPAKQKHKTTFYVRLRDLPFFLQRLDHKALAKKALTVQAFNDYQMVARQLLSNFPLWQWADWRGQAAIHAVLLGANAMTERLMVQIFLQGQYPTLAKPVITVIDSDATALLKLKDRYAALIKASPHRVGRLHTFVADPEFLASDNYKSAFDPQKKHAGETPLQILESGLATDPTYQSAYGQSITAYFVLGEDPKQNIRLAETLSLAIRRQRQGLAPIFIWVEDEKLHTLSTPAQQNPQFAGVRQHFGTLTYFYTHEEFFENKGDALAEMLHKQYLKFNPSDEAEASWSELSEDLRQANRAAADYFLTRLHSYGYHVPMTRYAETGLSKPTAIFHFAKGVRLSDADFFQVYEKLQPLQQDKKSNHAQIKKLKAELEQMVEKFVQEQTLFARYAEVEHNRWMAERLSSGWQPSHISAGDGKLKKRDNDKRLHHCLIPFADLPPSTQYNDFSSIAALDFYAKNQEINNKPPVRRSLWLGLLPLTTDLAWHLNPRYWQALEKHLDALLAEEYYIVLVALPEVQKSPSGDGKVVTTATNALLNKALAKLQAKDPAARGHYLAVLPDSENSDLSKAFKEDATTPRAEWHLDVLPAGAYLGDHDPLDAEGGLLTEARQSHRAASYVIERCQQVICFGEAQGERGLWMQWRRSEVPEIYRAFPPSQRDSQRRLLRAHPAFRAEAIPIV